MSDNKNEVGTIEWCINYAKRHGCLVISEARAELAALRAIIKEQEHDIETSKHHKAVVIDNYQRAIAEQARRLDEARKLIMYVMPSVEPYMVTQLRAWLAANAPQAEHNEGAPKSDDLCQCKCPGFDANRPNICPTCGRWHSDRIDGDPEEKTPQAEQEQHDRIDVMLDASGWEMDDEAEV